MTANQSERPRTHDPLTELARRWPGWHLVVTDLGGRCTELFATGISTVFVDTGAYLEDAPHAAAHVAAHLELHLDQLGQQMTPAQEDEANGLADRQLGRVASI